MDRIQRATDRHSGVRDRLLGGAARLHQPRQPHRHRAAGGPRRHHGDLHHLRHHDRGGRPLGRAGARRRRSRLLLFASTPACRSRLGFSQVFRSACWWDSSNGAAVAFLAAAADHRHAGHAQHRARLGADPGRSRAASHPRQAGIHVHRRRQSLRPARPGLHLRARGARP